MHVSRLVREIPINERRQKPPFFISKLTVQYGSKFQKHSKF
ncbi:hypothetical protein LEP1GSC058_2681 [Leptospira fainei serovar Hurstbridge str. BUT 6]|uniref:Uncharacterized protein n=1 Tax=Leptospira fainei serovar Hurstbridge str. BUT 6 TaxID=1193011 RepID=S3V0T0_9LEPT|nr:hypothetical protein LEP1GSC058_2681 [Leptospira fainei serovar Hurstbridge str. BUT 6]